MRKFIIYAYAQDCSEAAKMKALAIRDGFTQTKVLGKVKKIKGKTILYEVQAR